MLYELQKNTHVTDKNEITAFRNLLKKSHDDVRFYKGLTIRNELSGKTATVHVGDNVLVANADAHNDYIAIIDALYDCGDNLEDDKYALVTWFFRPLEISISKLPTGCSKNEIFLSTAKVDNVIDAETVTGLCTVHFNNVPHTAKSTENVFHCTKSFDGKKFKQLTDTNLPRYIKKLKHIAKTPKIKVLVSNKSIYSTLSPSKNTIKSCNRTIDGLSSPVSASSIGRLDATAVAHDILESDEDCEYADTVDDVEEVWKSQSVLKKKAIPNANKVDWPIKPLIENNSSNQRTHRTEESLKDLSISVHRLDEKVSEKENDWSHSRHRRSTRQSERLPGSSPTKKIKISQDAIYTSDEDDSGSFQSHCDKDFMKTSDCPSRRSTRQSAKKTAQSKKKERSRDNELIISTEEEEEIIDDSDNDQDFRIEKMRDFESSDDSDSDFVTTMQRPQSSKKSKTKRKCNSSKASVQSNKRLTSASSYKKSTKIRRAIIPERKAPLKLAASDFDLARERLHVAAVPDSLPCREKEFEAIYSFIEGKINSGTGGCMYISGVPGTGKTATVMEVISCLRESVADGMIQDFNYVDINGMRLTEPHQAYVSILKQLKDTKATPDHASELLTKHFNMRGKKATLLIVDELDLLWTRKQDVLYHIFDWPSHRHARLIVVAIANTMDLPERIMMNKVSSRLGLTRLAFLPYSFKQLQEIVISRLQGLPVFESDAIQLVARKVAAVSGDARRCLDVCRRAIEIAGKSRIIKKCPVKAATIDQVHGALQEMFASPMLMLMRNCSVHEKLFLNSVVAEFKRSGLEEATLGQVLHHHASLTQMEGLPPSSEASIMEVCNHLVSSRLLLLESGSYDIYSRIRLNVSVDDVLFALNKEI